MFNLSDGVYNFELLATLPLVAFMATWPFVTFFSSGNSPMQNNVNSQIIKSDGQNLQIDFP